MERIVELARQLGRRMAGHERTTLLKDAQKKLDEDDQAKELMEQYRQQSERIGQLDQEQKPIEVSDKHKLTELEQKLSTNAAISELIRRQADFVEMMRKVKTTIDNELQVEPRSD